MRGSAALLAVFGILVVGLGACDSGTPEASTGSGSTGGTSSGGSSTGSASGGSSSGGTTGAGTSTGGSSSGTTSTGGTTGGSTGGSTTGGCPGLANGGTINVDGMTGNDVTPCCGIGGNGACQTLTWAMRLIDAARARDVTIKAAVNGGGGDWIANETYPVVLGWGVELNAPGVFFLDPAPLETIPETFDVKTYSPRDTVGYASIVGSAASPVSVGMNSANSRQTGDKYAIAVETGSTLYIANASVNGSNRHVSVALYVAPGAKLLLGQDRSSGVTGTVTIGNTLGQDATDGYIGILCDGAQGSGGCTIQDADLGGRSSVVIQGQTYEDIDAEHFGTISLTSHPVIGVPPSAVGFNNCPLKRDAVSSFAVSVAGEVDFTFKNGTVQCIAGIGFLAGGPSGNDAPTLTLDNTIIQNTDLGIGVFAGTATLTNTTLRYNFIGVQQGSEPGLNGRIDLSGGQNTVICSSSREASLAFGTPGVDVYNGSAANLNASNVAWDTLGPDYFDCDGSYSCTCNLGSCTTTPGLDGMDAVEDSTLKGGITTTNASQSPNHCN